MEIDRIADIFIIGTILTIIILKITNVIKIAWIWLLCPIWILLGFGIILAAVLTIICLIHTKVIKEKE